jgi:hypothetical protein
MQIFIFVIDPQYTHHQELTKVGLPKSFWYQIHQVIKTPWFIHEQGVVLDSSESFYKTLCFNLYSDNH